MREILFKGKTKNGKWIEGFYQFSEDKKIAKIGYYEKGIDRANNSFIYCAYTTDVIPESVGQFTGLKDKNGKRIFEDDILAETWWGKSYAKNPILCKFHNGSFCFSQYYIWDTNDCKRAWTWKKRFRKKNLKYCEVIGNIHDNPELLGE